MSQNPQPDIDQAASQLLEKLTSLRQAKADAPESERRQAFERTIGEELSGRPADTAKRVTIAIREQLIADARARDTRAAQAEAELARLKGQLEAVTAERDRVQRELVETKTAGAAAPAATPETTEALERVRGALFKTSGGEKVDPSSIGLSEAGGRMFHLVQELLNFALVYEQGVNVLLQSLQIGPGMDTQQLKGMKEEVRERFRACLENKEGSVKALRAALEKKKSFLIDLNQAYQASLFAGTTSVLGQLDPQPLAEAHRKPIIGVDYDKAWKALGRLQNDLAALSKTEMWERFYLETFRSKLSTYLG